MFDMVLNVYLGKVPVSVVNLTANVALNIV